ncbi:hypothetical protein AWB78_01316 [Caballeronia calidae]|uniref:HTH cro/C1-type domain-containing protein n=1 Tax=Caballeronia calidae TaxID=1777139 RepID=A0A158A6C2_9BURK|nr:helix-turn-helix transcriptional regulator [Caballeronia calidae]SAK53338.1 hypothetical protein AWB78_01316 [Caballeronia calidae]
MKKSIERRPPTPEELEEARRLAAIWEDFKTRNPGVSQEWLGKEAGIGGQSAVSQYLLGKIALNLEAMLRLCGVLGAKPMDVSPRLMTQFFGDEGSRLTAVSQGSIGEGNPNTSLPDEGVKNNITASAEELKRQIMQAVAEEGLSDELLNALAWMIRAGMRAPVRGDQHHTQKVDLNHGRSSKRGNTGTG